MYPNMDTASNYSAGDPKKNSEAHKTSGLYTITNYSKMLYHVNFIKCKIYIYIVLPSYYLFSDVLFYGSIISFISGILLLMSFASPYWLQSWGGTESPFENMGLWEFCFHNFRHPDYQYDTLFDGCHWVWGNEYRYIREKLLPGKY